MIQADFLSETPHQSSATDPSESIILVCSVIGGGLVRFNAVHDVDKHFRNNRDNGVIALPVSVFPTYRSRFEREAGLISLSVTPSLAYVSRWLYKAPILGKYSDATLKQVDWLRRSFPVEFQELWQAYVDASPFERSASGGESFERVSPGPSARTG